MSVALAGFRPSKAAARVTELVGQPGDVNTAAEPGRVAPRGRDWEHGIRGGTAEYTFPPHSFTLIRLE